MKKFMSTLLAGTMFVTSCTQHSQSSKSEKPVQSEPAKEENIQATEKKMDQDASASNANTNSDVASNAMLTAAVSSMMKSNDLYIKDFDGKDITIDQYKLNPSQYYLVFKKLPDSSSFRALNTSIAPVAADLKTDSHFTITYKIYDVVGDGSSFKGSSLGTPKVSQTLTLDSNPFKLMENRAAIQTFLDNLKANTQLASQKSFSSKLSNFLFPTAYAYKQKQDFMIMGIVFSSVSVISYLFSFYTVGTITASVGIVCWIIYFELP